LSALGWKPMSEAEWLACQDPDAMLRFLRGRASDRKLRLFACACCRSVWGRLLDPRSKRVVETAERFADGLADCDELNEAQAAAVEVDLAQYGIDYDALASAAWATSFTGLLTEDAAAEAATSVARSESGTRVCCELLRDVFGNPFRPAPLDPTWLAWQGGTVPRLAQATYDGRAFERMPVLADALEDAGCTDAAILSHCRSGGEHARGCWVLDLLLGKE
jgi:hypothetical protein